MTDRLGELQSQGEKTIYPERKTNNVIEKNCSDLNLLCHSHSISLFTHPSSFSILCRVTPTCYEFYSLIIL